MKLRLREIRDAKGYSQTELGKLVGLSGAAISRLEAKGGYTLDKLERIARALDVSFYTLISDRPAELLEAEDLLNRLTAHQRMMILKLARDMAAESRSHEPDA